MKNLIISLLFGVSLSVNAMSVKADTAPEERVYILSTVWRNLRDNFAFPHHFEQTNPDSLFKAFIPKVMGAESEQEFSLLMTEFLAQFGDAHTRYYANSKSAGVPVQFVGMDNKVYVKNIGKQFVGRIPIGSQLVKIDGVPTTDLLESKIYPYVAAPNADWKFRKSLDTFLNGESGSEVVLEFLTPKHKIETISLSRIDPQQFDAYDWTKAMDSRAAYVEQLPGDIAYMRMATFTKPEEVNKVFADNLPLFRNSKGVIFDIRGNRGGTDECWNPAVFDYTAPANVDKNAAITMKCRVANSVFQEYGGTHPLLKDYVSETAMDVVRTGGSYFSQAPDSLKIKCQIILLTDGYTGSAAEDFAVTMKNLGLATLVGTHTCGVISHPRYFDLPNGDSYGISTWAYFNPDGTGIIETGIIPDVEVELTADDLVKGTDSQLSKAIEILKK
ncbi:MAG: hypothetical protein K2K82_04460 [Muribaculaceae bacterium]|nr:hypothetical protein [Muribaculaceae bacterium]